MTINRPSPSPLALPRLPSQSMAFPNPGSGIQALRAPTVLVVQPDRTIRTVALSALQASGYRGVGVARGDEALFMLLERRFDAILLGAALPGIEARDFCSRLRSIQSHTNTPVIYLLHPNEQQQMDGLFAAGGDDFLTLPLSPALLKTRLAGRLSRGAAQKRASVDPGEFSRSSTADELSPGAGVMVLRSWAPPTPGLDAAGPALGSRGGASQLGLQVECIYRHGGRVERLADGVVYALFDGPTGIFDAGQCSKAILSIGAGLGGTLHERPRVALGIVACRGTLAIEEAGAGREAMLENAFAAALEHCKTARAMQVMVSPELHAALGGLAHVRYARARGGTGTIEEPLEVSAGKLRRAREHAA